MMERKKLLAALRWLKVQTGSLACAGCGHEHNCGIHGCAILREAEAALAKRSEWISVGDRLPASEWPVLTFVGYADNMIGFQTVSTYFAFDPEPHWQWDGLVRDLQRTLYWMPLPEPPEEHRKEPPAEEDSTPDQYQWLMSRFEKGT